MSRQGYSSQNAGPFSDMRNGDVRLRSKDGINFAVQKTKLSAVSPMFTMIFQDNPERLVVEVEEDRRTLDTLLRLCYKYTYSPIEDVNFAMSIFRAASYYRIADAVNASRVRLEALAEQDPIAVYGLALAHGLDDLGKVAAKCYLSRPLIGAAIPALSGISGAQYHRLLEYHIKCQRVVNDLDTNVLWLKNIRLPQWFGECDCPTASSSVRTTQFGRGLVSEFETEITPRLWWMQYMKAVRDLLAETPGRLTVLDGIAFEKALKGARKCEGLCSEAQTLEDMKTFVEDLKAEVEQRLSWVKF